VSMGTARHTEFHTVNRSKPCQVCGATARCTRGDDGLILCHELEGEQPGFVHLGRAKGDPEWTQYRREGDPLLQGNGWEAHRPYTANGRNHDGFSEATPINWEDRSRELAGNLNADRASELANDLGLPECSLSALPLLGYDPSENCWTFPEHDGQGQIIGINRRYKDGTKKAAKDSRRGLSIPSDWAKRNGPVFLPEGASNTLALTAVGLSAVGRPNNTTGAELLAELLKDVPADRRVIMVADWDPKPTGDWPGRDGADKIAAELADKLGRRIERTMPPPKPDGEGSYKDVRKWTQAQNLDPTISDAWADAGETLQEKLQAKVKNFDPPGKKQETLGFRWEPISSAAFAVGDYRHSWLIVKIFVDGQAAIVGGAQKTLKTSAGAIDMAVSLASASRWLDAFQCPTRKRVAVLSAESGPWALQSIARRICAARGIELAELGDYLRWQFTLPQLSALDQLAALREGLQRDGIEVAIVDPLYLCLLAGAKGAKAENLYDTGPLLLRIAQTCLSVGATPILLHHTTKPSARKLEPLELTDLAFSGVAEFARQWILLSRREAFDADTPHRLWMVAGGSVGHGGLWAVDVDEGKLADDFSGRKWVVTVKTASAAKEVSATNKEEEKRQKQQTEQGADGLHVVHVHEVNDPSNQGISFTALRDATGISARRFGPAVTWAIENEKLVEVPGAVSSGQGAQRKARILKRCLAEFA
jgi:hypothetical protein